MVIRAGWGNEARGSPPMTAMPARRSPRRLCRGEATLESAAGLAAGASRAIRAAAVAGPILLLAALPVPAMADDVTTPYGPWLLPPSPPSVQIAPPPALEAGPGPLPVPQASPPVPVLRGLYLPAGRLLRGPAPHEWEAWRLAGLNAVVVDLKNDEGWVLAPLDVPEVTAWRTRWSPGVDLAKLIATAQTAGFQVVVRIVALKDSRAVRARPDLALHDLEGEVWRDASGQTWLDPRHPEVRQYIASLARAAAAMGFAEVHLDYIRLPSEGALHRLDWSPSVSRADAVAALVAEVADALEPTGTPLSVAIFGQSCVVPGDMGIGQQCETLAEHAPVLSPMAYPSHYALGAFGLRMPEREPGLTVSRTLQATARRVGIERVRPWLQAFSLRVRYGAAELAAQIQAAETAGTAGWLLWNPRGVYPNLQAAIELAGRRLARAEGLPGLPRP